MYKIVEARSVGFNIKQFEIEAPRIARKQQPGQFIILRLHENGERIPLTIKGSDPAAGTVTIVVQSIGKTTSLLNCWKPATTSWTSLGRSAIPRRSRSSARWRFWPAAWARPWHCPRRTR